jgi:AcrR family transcriptional regulator
VAARSGVARTTIYRWWPTKGVLAIASFLANFRSKLVYAQTDSTPADFHLVVGSLAATLSGPAGRVAASVMAHAQSDSETRRLFLEQFSEPLRKETSALLRRGVDQGQFRADLDIARVIDAVVGAVYLRLLLGQSLDPDWVRHLIDTLLEGCLVRSDQIVGTRRGKTRGRG